MQQTFRNGNSLLRLKYVHYLKPNIVQIAHVISLSVCLRLCPKNFFQRTRIFKVPLRMHFLLIINVTTETYRPCRYEVERKCWGKILASNIFRPDFYLLDRFILFQSCQCQTLLGLLFFPTNCTVLSTFSCYLFNKRYIGKKVEQGCEEGLSAALTVEPYPFFTHSFTHAAFLLQVQSAVNFLVCLRLPEKRK